ncbi:MULTISPECIES: helix-turn-helix transcriptional regulator [unclassified Bacillus cereus group]|uniref:helix-turn-helix domain-containing protein n=1 Tax=Bacillus cereus group TaxID=86661 RepID=UPI0022E065DE|nr:MULTISPECIES: helix-turn-helix transcriptional regulator [unclassified Bacillus cereus group]WAI24890.1 MAG: helix-turn-helix transcriptional regulator [Bacillus paranthracis]MDA2665161.1 helix-turn-helix transcriptional regulator [Bacillus cereus group sp. Bc032]MDA2675916.1 helix-turn-helix transcriptional regulator [Bacillus cereus group sp. Bc031]MDA2681399.1 helix-turn-helix transcriptional regulator [Bacillus cereus group sp. Bc029]MDA2686855.1 helix-turn-helix transcriptional regulat
MDKKFGKKVKMWLFVNGMKQGELAKMLNVSGPYLSDILHGKREGKKVKEKINRILESEEI